MNKIRLEVLGLSARHVESDSCALVLGEASGTRRLPIIIGIPEAHAIFVEMHDVTASMAHKKRPMPHDLFKGLADHYNVNVHEVLINALKEGVFYAKIICSLESGEGYLELDSRTSDAIAISIRVGCPVYVDSKIMDEAGVELSEIEGEKKKKTSSSIAQKTPQKSYQSDISQTPSNKKSSFENLSLDQLNALLLDAEKNEDYEKCAQIKEEIDKRSK